MAKIEIQKEGLAEFVEEIGPQLAEAEGLVLAWNSEDAKKDTIDSLFRTFHNIKGTSGMFGLALVQEVFHNAESMLGICREKGIKPPEETSSLLLDALDEFKKITAYAMENGTEPDDKPYNLMHKLSEARRALTSTEAVEASADGNAKAEGKKAGNASDESLRISAQHASELVEIVSDFIQLQNRLEVSLGSDGASSGVKNDIRRFSGRLQGFVLSIRLSPIQPLLSGLQRTAAAAAREVGKKFRMQINGGDTQLDRRVIELLRDPLIHMIRNSIDHGLEAPSGRIEAKKPMDGLIVFEAFQQAGQVVLSLSDDGRGIDPIRVKSKALQKGIISQSEHDKMSERDAVRLIFKAGFSTAEQVTSLSGRGVGMDAVKSSVELIGGTVDVESQLGRGSKVTLTLPLTLAIVKSLAFRAGGQMYAVPQTSVEEVITESMARSHNQLGEISQGGRVLHLRRYVIPVVPLRKLFKMGEKSGDSVFVVVRHRNERFAVEVDSIVGPRDFVSQPLPAMHGKVNVINGVNQLNSGEYIALLDLGSFSSMLDSVTVQGTARLPGEGAPGTEDINASDVFRSQQKLVFFRSGKLLAVPVQAIRQVVPVTSDAVDGVGDKLYLTYQGKTYPILRLNHHFGGGPLKKQPNYTAMLVQREGSHAAVLCEEFHGIHRLPSEFELLIKAPGIQGSVNHEGRTYLVTNINTVFGIEFPEVFKEKALHASKFHVLVAEDDPFFATSLSDFLRGEGFLVSTCADGALAKEYLEGTLNSENPRPAVDFLISDLEMPNMGGLELLSWVRNTEAFNTLPVIMCTAVGNEATKRAAAKLGIDYYAGKMKYEDLLPYIVRRQKGSEIGIVGDNTLRVADETEVNADKRVLAFEVGTRLYGVEIRDLKEISSAHVPTKIPGLPDFSSNIVGFRGHPIPVIDLRRMAGGGAQTAAPEQIVAKFGPHTCALWVDKVFNVRRVGAMSRSTGLIKKDEHQGISALVGDVLWDDGTALAVIDGTRVSKLLDFIKGRTARFEISFDEEKKIA